MMQCLRACQPFIKLCQHLREPLQASVCRALSTTDSRLVVAEDNINKPSIASSKVWKDHAETVVIGGGVVGVSVAYHLAKAGQEDVVLLEKMELTAGSTWHAAGLTTKYHSSINMKNVNYYSVELFKRLEEETGQDVGLHITGTVRLASCEERVKEFKYHMSQQGWNKAPMRLIGPDEIQEMVPILDTSKVLLGQYIPDDGHVDPYSVTQAMAIGARQYGATIHQQTPVTAMRQAADGGWELDTPRGGIKAKRVVNAAGFHARELGKMVGLDFPLVPVDHQYFVTNTIPEIAALKKEIPVLRDLEGSYYLRQERQGMIVGPYEPADKMRCVDDWYINDPPKDFGKELYPADLDRIQWNIERAMEFFPVLEKAEIVQVVSGPMMASPDQLPMVGPCQGLRNYWTAIGAFGGVAYSGGLGKYLAGWIMNGEPPFDLIETDCNRYASWAGQDFTLAKAREGYGLTNAIIYPHEERFAGRPTKRTTDIYEQQIERGAEMGFHAGWEQPNWFALPGDEAGHKPSFHRTNWFEPVRRECDLVMTKAGIIDLTPFGKLEVFGPDACRFIDHVFANNVPKVGHTKISHMLTPTGHVYAEMTVTQTEPNKFLCITGSTNERRDLGWLQEQAIAGNFDVACQTVTDDYAVLGLAGPKSRDIMAKLVTNDMTNSGFPFLTAQNCEVAGTKVKAVRISYTGELGWELYMNIHDIGTVYNALLEIGEEFGVGDFGTYAMNSLRLEKGFRMWGAEMGVNENPFEAGLEQFIATKKVADFIGEEALTKLRKEDLKRHLVFMTVDTSDVDPEGNESIWHNDKVVGMTTSGGYGYTVNQSLAFGYVPPELSNPGSRVYVELLGEKRPATICKDALLLTEPVRSAFPK